jgi:hypothetical protein
MSFPSWSFNLSWQQHLPCLVTFFTTPNTSLSSYFWTIHHATNGLIAKFHFYTIIPSPTRSLTKYLKPIMFKFYHVSVMGEWLAYNLTNFFNLSIFFPNFFIAIQMHPRLPHFSIANFPLRCVHTSHWPCGYPSFTSHPWQCVHKDP